MELCDWAAFDLAAAVFASSTSPSATGADEPPSLIKASPVACDLLGLQPTHGTAPPPLSAADLLLTGTEGAPRHDGTADRAGAARQNLDDLARRSKGLRWGQGVEVDYLVHHHDGGMDLRRAVVRVAVSGPCSSSPSSIPPSDGGNPVTFPTTPYDKVYSILFLRPVDLPRPVPISPSLAGALPSSPPPPFPAGSDSVPSPPPLDRSCSSSEYLSDSHPRTKRRIVTGKDRVHLPFTPDVRNALAHATTRIVETSPSASAAATRAASTSASEMASLDLSDAASATSTTSSTRARGRLPSVLQEAAARNASLDESLLRLSSRVDSHAGALPHFRLPINHEDGSGKVLSPARERPDPLADSSPAAEESPASSPDPAVEEALKHRERDARPPLTITTLTNLIETMPIMAFLADSTGQVVWLSRAWYRYTGQDERYNPSFEEWMSMFHPDDLAHAFGVYLGAMKSGDAFSFEYRVKGKDDKLRWHMCQGRPHYDETGAISNWMCNTVNIDDLVNTRHDALLVQERTKAVLAGSELTLLTIDTSLNITFFEGRFPPFNFRCDPPKLVGERFHELCADEDLREGVRKVLDEEEEVVHVQTATDDGKGGKRHTRYRLVPLHGDPSIPASHPDANAVSGCIAVGVDVSERVRTEEALEVSRVEASELAASELAAREASRLKTEFLTTISHEIRTPIAGILGICELLLAESARLASDQRALVEKAVRSGEILLDLVGAVLDVRKVETGELKLEQAPLTLAEVLADARLFSVIAQKKGLAFEEDVRVSYEGELLGDRLRLRQVLANALGNSIKFTRSGRVTLGVQQIAEDDSRTVVRFEITDTGVGIDEAVLPTLFRPFKQASVGTAREYGGSGLGLTIAKNLVEMMDGSIELTSKLGQGSRMTITIPFRKASSSRSSDDDAEMRNESTTTASPADDLLDTEMHAGANGCVSPVRLTDEVVDEMRARRRPEDVHILLAEDNELISEIVTRTLRKARFVVDAVDNGQKAVEQVHKHPYSVVLMDGQMPGVDGYEATKMIRRSSDPRIRNLRIVALTASAIAGDRERCLDAGMSTYLAKPVRAKELVATIWQQVELADRVQNTA